VFAKSGLFRDNSIAVTKLDPFEILIVNYKFAPLGAAVEITGVMWHWKCGQFAALASSFSLIVSRSAPALAYLNRTTALCS
jgi:hypothetical protein